MTMEHRKTPTSRQRTGADRSQQLGASDTPDSLSEVCEEFGVPGFLCSCDLAATAISTAGRDVCTYQPFEAACPKKYDEMCEADPPERPPGGGYGGGQQAGASTYVMYGLGAVALGTAGAYFMDE